MTSSCLGRGNVDPQYCRVVRVPVRHMILEGEEGPLLEQVVAKRLLHFPRFLHYILRRNSTSKTPGYLMWYLRNQT